MAVSLTLSYTLNSQSVANNTSKVTVTVKASWTGGSYNKLQKSGTLWIDGTEYSFTSSFNTSRTTSGSQTLYSKTVTLTHNSNGTKTLACKATYTTGVSSGTIGASFSKALPTIDRPSTISASNGTLGTAQKLIVTKKVSSFTHTITYTCGTASGTICTKSSSESVSFTPPLSLASQNISGTTVSIKLSIATYNGNTSVGTNTKTITCTIPSTVVPSFDYTITEPTGYMDVFGRYILGKSKLKVDITPIPAYGSPIKNYTATVDGVTYTSSSFTTDVLKESGQITITVKDARGRSLSITESGSVYEYTEPVINNLTVKRCDVDGTENTQGEYVQVMFTTDVTIIGVTNKNIATYTLKYKKTSEDAYTEVNPLGDGVTSYGVEDQTYIFPADSSSSYDIELSVADAIATTSRTTSASTAFALMHWGSDGTSLGIGKLAEEPNLLDIGMPTRHMGGLRPPVLEPETDLNDIRTPNTYTGDNISTYNYANCPVTSGTFTLIVESGGEDGQVKQTYISCSKYKPERYSRFYYQNAWGDWFWANTDEYVLYENDSGSNTAITLAAAASHYRYIEFYFTDNNGKAGGYTKVYSPNGKTIFLNLTEAASTIYSRQTAYTISGTSVTPDLTTASYYRITSAGSVSTSIGTNYIKIVRVIGRA